jgi:hypothetical protein
VEYCHYLLQGKAGMVALLSLAGGPWGIDWHAAAFALTP